MTGITLYGAAVPPKEQLKLLRVWIEHWLSLKVHATAANAAVRRSAGFLWQVAKRKGSTQRAIHHFTIMMVIPAMLWG